MNRAETLARIEEDKIWDIIIIGGGATGLGAALDSASRNYDTLLIESVDFAKGTSGRSTKLVHGGVRYLEQGNIKLVREALRERFYLLKNAPHITSSMGFVVPAYSWVQKIYYGTGLSLYNILSNKLSIGKTSWLSRKKTLVELPGITPEKLVGGIVYFDGQFDDARLAIDIASTAHKYGAAVLNYCTAQSLIKSNKKVSGITVFDEILKKSYTLKAKAVINATGVFADEIMEMDEPEGSNIITPSQGIHIVLDKKFFPGRHALMIPKTDDKRVLFAVPWHNRVIIGTTDTFVDEMDIEPKPLKEEIDFMLHHVNRYFRDKIQLTDIKSIFAGLRPLVKMKGIKSTALLSRDHSIIVSPSNLVTVTGGKWTTYRKMAEDAVNNAAFVGKLPAGNCITEHLPINSSIENNFYYDDSRLPALYTTERIADFIHNEMAVTVEDILARRTRLLFLDAQAAIDIAPQIARQMAAISGHDETWIKKEIELFNKTAEQYLVLNLVNEK